MDDCCICLNELNKNYIELECNHKYHSKCIKTWFNIKNRMLCPLCKQEKDYKNKRKTRKETLLNRIYIFMEQYYIYIHEINKEKYNKIVLFERLLKLINNNKYVLNYNYFRNNLKECIKKANDNAKFNNYNYWLEKFKL